MVIAHVATTLRAMSHRTTLARRADPAPMMQPVDSIANIEGDVPSRGVAVTVIALTAMIGF